MIIIFEFRAAHFRSQLRRSRATQSTIFPGTTPALAQGSTMLLVDVYLDKSPIQGIGVFAKNHIAKGTLVWKLDPRFDRIIDVETYEGETGPVKNYLDRYSYPDRRDPAYIVFEADDARYMNHDDEPNCDVSSPEETYALRDIAPGEEMTCNYNLFFETGFDFLGDRHLQSED
ncbi:SET domain-containing protein-lysine N-methyltransferase [Mesorhizobium australicum]|nr:MULTISPECIES: SET domain-containing protein-lysine N-methyltransferase [unclassified Mesorhizobium]